MAERNRHIHLRARGCNTWSARVVATGAVFFVLVLGAGPAGQGPGLAESPRGLKHAAPSQAGSNHLRLLFTQIPVASATGGIHLGDGLPADVRVPDGCRIVILDSSDPAGEVVNLTPSFAAAGRPSLSFDGQRILFVGKRGSADPLSVWQMSVRGGGQGQLVSLPGDCDDAIYLSTIYRIDADRPVHQIAFRSSAPGGNARSLYTARLDGSHVRQITFTPHEVFDPCLLSDGRLLIGIENEPEQTSANATRAAATALYTVHVDGTELFPFAGLHEPPAVRSMPCETAEGSIVYVESAVEGNDRGGSLVAVARTRSLHTRRLIADDSEGVYYSPSSMPDGNLLVSYRSASGGSYGLFLLDPRTGERTAKVFDAPRWHDIDAVAVAPRPEPAGRSSVVDDGMDSAQLYCLSAYLSNTSAGKRIKRDEIKRLRVIRALTGAADLSRNQVKPKRDREEAGNAKPGRAKEAVLGEIPVEEDGSFFLELPARTPLRLETLSETGDILQAMRSWMWLMPGERRGCIGCHEDRELTPPNRHVMALRKLPRRMGVARRKELEQNSDPRRKGGYGR